jgi:probable rRNA maturation factor
VHDPTTADPTAEPESSSGEPPDGSPAKLEKDSAPITVGFHLDAPDTHPPSAGWIEPRLADALHRCGVTQGRLDVTLLDDVTMGRLHQDHCGDPSPTDVITFDLADPPSDRSAPRTRVEGDLVVGRDVAIRQADARGHEAREELLLYAVHGLLHLLGEDDHDDAAYQQMHRREDELLTAMGLGPLFHGRTTASESAEARP